MKSSGGWQGEGLVKASAVPAWVLYMHIIAFVRGCAVSNEKALPGSQPFKVVASPAARGLCECAGVASAARYELSFGE